ncbi:hypothetical protein [Methylobacillus flagellatus]|uniref:Uncharacterized protein n=3 Tax=root TaxID=1 RepID=Q1H2Q5_METFK|nr:hypothetical protein [Methylobacillus flagellatus]ABE49088.1 hypothetical protein Mfla_0820 [Methylobacillus flagellatus KT]ABE49232.1 hypothetical protein Mfla_0964 [Methylobacillus flagellatus KT]
MYKALKALDAIPPWFWMLGAAGVALYIIKKGSVAAAAQDAVAGAISGVGSLAGSVGGGVVVGVGDLLGVPRTNESKCEMAKRLGNSWDASRYCDAGDFIAWQFNDLFTSGQVDFIGGGGSFGGHGATGSW